MEAREDQILSHFSHLMSSHVDDLQDDWPNNHISRTGAQAHELLAEFSTIDSFTVGTGMSIFSTVLIPAMMSAREEITLVTCFWADSPTRRLIKKTLIDLARARQQHVQEPGVELATLRITICFSSTDQGFASTFISHPDHQALNTYGPERWAKLGLPSENQLQAGSIDLQVRSRFFRPFSVMHPKFLIVDRARAWIPSCNVSWENWLEGCVSISGIEAITPIQNFFQAVWLPGIQVPEIEHVGEIDEPHPDGLSSDAELSDDEANVQTPDEDAADSQTPDDDAQPKHSLAVEPSSPVEEERRVGRDIKGASVTITTPTTPVYTIFLPSPHHQSLRLNLSHVFPIPVFRNSLLQAATKSRTVGSVVSSVQTAMSQSPPATPLNIALTALIEKANSKIFIQTPNLTALPVIRLLVGALGRGVDVEIVLSERLMLAEQLVTALLWTTGLAVRTLIKAHKKMIHLARLENERMDLEQGILSRARPKVGNLKIVYFQPVSSQVPTGRTPDHESRPEPVKTHLKLTVVDDRYSVFGSGNLDRASWFTSQEIGYLADSSDIAALVQSQVKDVLVHRHKLVYASSHQGSPS